MLLFTFCLSFAVRQTYFVSILKFIFSIFVLWHFFYFLILEEVFSETNEIMIMYVSLSLKTWFQDESQLFVCLFWACLHIFLLCFFFHFVRAVSKIVEYLFSSSFRLQSKMSYSFFFFFFYFILGMLVFAEAKCHINFEFVVCMGRRFIYELWGRKGRSGTS